MPTAPDFSAGIPEWPRLYRGMVQSQFQLQASGLFSTSPYTGQTMAYEPNVQVFICNVTSPQRRGPEWRHISGIIAGMRGRARLLRMVDYHRLRCGYDEAVRRARGQEVVNWDDDATWDDGAGWEGGFMPPVVVIDEAAPQDSRSVLLRSFPASVNGVMQPGDLGEVRPNGLKANHAHLYEMTAESRSNASGKTRVHFEPGLRAAVLPGDQFVIRYPTSVFQFVSDQEGALTRTAPGNLGAFGMSLVEKLPHVG